MNELEPHSAMDEGLLQDLESTLTGKEYLDRVFPLIGNKIVSTPPLILLKELDFEDE